MLRRLLLLSGLTTFSPDATVAGAGSSSSSGVHQRHSPSNTLTQPLLRRHQTPQMQPGSSSGPSTPSPPPTQSTGQAIGGHGAELAHYQHHQQEQQKQWGVAGRGAEPVDPYSLAGQAGMILGLCQLLGVRRVLLVAHADGCAVAAHAAAAAVAAGEQQFTAQPMQQKQMQGQLNEQGFNSSRNGSTSWQQGRQGEGHMQAQGQGAQVAGAGKSGSGRGVGTAAGDANSLQDSDAYIVGPEQSKQARAGDMPQPRCGVLVPPLPLPPCSAATSTVISSNGGQEANRQANHHQPVCLLPPQAVSTNNRNGGISGGSNGSSAGSNGVDVVGLVLLHPNLTGHQLPAGVTRLLAASGLGRSVLRSLLRNEVRVGSLMSQQEYELSEVS